MKRALLLGALLALGGLAAAQTLDFKIKRKKGDVRKTRVNGRIDTNGMTLLITYLSTDEVMDVTPEGNLKIKNTAEQASFLASGVEQLKDPKPDVSEVLLRPSGELLESTSTRQPIIAQRRGNRLTSVVAPPAPVAVGGTWGHKWTDDEKLLTKAAETTYTFVAVEKVGNTEAAKVDFDFKETGASQNMTAKGTLWLRTDTFEIVKSEYTVTNYRAPGVFVGLTVLMKTQVEG
jgi:hypothetical protein